MLFFRGLLFIVSWMLIILTANAQPEIQQVATDHTPPTLTHEPVSRIVEGQPLTLTVRASDDMGLDRVRLFYRVDALSEFREALFQAIDHDRYEVVLDADELLGIRLDYYVEAIDKVGHVTALGNGIAPLVVMVVSSLQESQRWGWKKILGAVVVAAVVGSLVVRDDKPPPAGSSPPSSDSSAEVTIIGVSVPSQ